MVPPPATLDTMPFEGWLQQNQCGQGAPSRHLRRPVHTNTHTYTQTRRPCRTQQYSLRSSESIESDSDLDSLQPTIRPVAGSARRRRDRRQDNGTMCSKQTHRRSDTTQAPCNARHHAGSLPQQRSTLLQRGSTHTGRPQAAAASHSTVRCCWSNRGRRPSAASAAATAVEITVAAYIQV